MDETTARTRLTEERERLERVARSVRNRAPDPADGDEGSLGERMADVATDVEEQQESRDLAGDAERDVTEIDAALARLDDGTWGACAVCGTAIDDERLDARPQTDRCREHAA